MSRYIFSLILCICASFGAARDFEVRFLENGQSTTRPSTGTYLVGYQVFPLIKVKGTRSRGELYNSGTKRVNLKVDYEDDTFVLSGTVSIPDEDLPQKGLYEVEFSLPAPSDASAAIPEANQFSRFTSVTMVAGGANQSSAQSAMAAAISGPVPGEAKVLTPSIGFTTVFGNAVDRSFFVGSSGSIQQSARDQFAPATTAYIHFDLGALTTNEKARQAREQSLKAPVNLNFTGATVAQAYAANAAYTEEIKKLPNWRPALTIGTPVAGKRAWLAGISVIVGKNSGFVATIGTAFTTQRMLGDGLNVGDPFSGEIPTRSRKVVSWFLGFSYTIQ